MGKIVKLIVLVAIATVPYFTDRFYFANDKEQQSAEAFLRNDPHIATAIGNLNSVSLRRYVSVGKTGTKGSYRLYDYIVKGPKERSNIVIRATSTGQPPTYHFSVESFDH